MALNLKEIDFKEFLFKKGDRIAFIGAALFMALLVVYGLFINGMGNGTASANAEELAKLREADQNALRNSRPNPDLKKIDPELLQAGVLNPLDPEPYAFHKQFFNPITREDNKWRLPEVLVPDEFQVELLRGLARTYLIDRSGKRMMFLREKKPKDQAGAQPGVAGGPGGKGGRFGGLGSRLGMLGGGMPGGAAGGTEDADGSGMGGVAGLGVQGNVPERELIAVPLERIAKDNIPPEAGVPAETTLPLRMAIVHGAFPYRKQMEEFRRALRFSTLYQMEAEVYPEFLGLKIERRTYRLNDRLQEDWKEIDLVKELRPYLIYNAEPEDYRLMQYGIVWSPRDRLVVPRPQLSRDQMYPEVKLDSIKKQIEEYDRIAKSQMPVFVPPKTRFSEGAGFDEYENAAVNPSMPGGMGMGGEDTEGMGMKGMRGASSAGMIPGAGMMPGAGRVPGAGIGPGGMMPGGAGAMMPGQPGMPGAMPPAGVPMMPGARPGMMPPGTDPAMAGIPGGPGQQGFQDRFYPEKALLRFQDPTVKPGFKYEYRLTIRMKNPLFKREDKAVAKTYTERPEIHSTPIVIPQKVVVPSEFEFYMVAEDRKKPGLNNGAWVQIHRWLDKTKNDWRDGAPSGADVPVGDWTIAEQIPAQRGEYIGRIEDQEVPMWWPLSESFTLAARPDARRRVLRGRRGIPVDFNTHAILVDFGPQQKLTRKDGSIVEDNSELDALVLLPDGRLVVRNSRDDTENKQRKERLDAWKKWVNEVRTAKEGVRLRQLLSQPGMGGAGAGGIGGAGMPGRDN